MARRRKQLHFIAKLLEPPSCPAGLRLQQEEFLDAAIIIGDSVIRVGDEAPWRIAESELGGTAQIFHRPAQLSS
jgi:hypothetical protein